MTLSAAIGHQSHQIPVISNKICYVCAVACLDRKVYRGDLFLRHDWELPGRAETFLPEQNDFDMESRTVRELDFEVIWTFSTEKETVKIRNMVQKTMQILC